MPHLNQGIAPSSYNVSNARLDFPLPDTPVMTVSLPFGIATYCMVYIEHSGPEGKEGVLRNEIASAVYGMISLGGITKKPVCLWYNKLHIINCALKAGKAAIFRIKKKEENLWSD